MRKRTTRFAPLLALLGLGVPACLLDFNQFETTSDASGAMAGAGGLAETGGTGAGGGSTGGSGGGSTGGSGGAGAGGGVTVGGSGGSGGGDGGSGGGSGSSGGSGGGDGGSGDGGQPIGSGGETLGGAPGSGGDSGCGSGTKLCGPDCVPDDRPETGCAAASCNACPNLPGATTACSAGDCALGTCEPGFFDCDGIEPTGCEHSSSSFDEFACGGCDADCTTLGLSNCQSGLCGCATDNECRGAGNPNSGYQCNSRVCTCGGETCNRGETCGRSGGSAECRCGSDVACSDGWTCCPSGSGPNCKQLDGTDAANCGACGFSCATGQICVAGVCQ